MQEDTKSKSFGNIPTSLLTKEKYIDNSRPFTFTSHVQLKTDFPNVLKIYTLQHFCKELS